MNQLIKFYDLIWLDTDVNILFMSMYDVLMMD